MRGGLGVGECHDEKEGPSRPVYFGGVWGRWREEFFKPIWAAKPGIKAMSLCSIYDCKNKQIKKNPCKNPKDFETEIHILKPLASTEPEI